MLALMATALLSFAKLVVAAATGSIGVLSEAIHSGLDLLSSLVTFFTVRASARPADWDHPFGHGKLESLSALLEAFLLLVAAGYIVYESVDRWKYELPVMHLDWALAVTGVSVVLNLFVYFQNRSVGREEESIAIETNAYHFLTDVFSSLAVFVGLALIYFTGWQRLDPIMALLISVYILWVAVSQMKKSIAELSDTTLPAEEISKIQRIIKHHQKYFLNFHDLRTRKAGYVRHADFHLTVCQEQKVKMAHQVCDEIEEELMGAFKEVSVNIHVEPCGNHGPACEDTCRFYGKPKAQVSTAGGAEGREGTHA